MQNEKKGKGEKTGEKQDDKLIVVQGKDKAVQVMAKVKLQRSQLDGLCKKVGHATYRSMRPELKKSLTKKESQFKAERISKKKQISSRKTFIALMSQTPWRNDLDTTSQLSLKEKFNLA